MSTSPPRREVPPLSRGDSGSGSSAAGSPLAVRRLQELSPPTTPKDRQAPTGWSSQSPKPSPLGTGLSKLNLSSLRKEAEEAKEAVESILPLELELGLLGGPRLTALPSHAGQQLPRFAGHSERTVAPAATKRGGSLTYPAHAARGSGQPRRGGWAPRAGTSAQGWPRPSSAASQTADTRPTGAAQPSPQPRQPAASAASYAKQQRWAVPAGGARGSARRPHSATAASTKAAPTAADAAEGRGGGVRPSSAAVRRAAAAKEREPHRQFTQMLKRQMAPEGYVGSHVPAPDGRLPPSFVASLHRNQPALSAVTMVPATLRAWEASVLQDEGLRAKLGIADHVARATPPPPREPPHPEGAAPFSKHEMRQFLRHAQRYFVSVDPKQPFAVPRTGWQPGARTTFEAR